MRIIKPLLCCLFATSLSGNAMAQTERAYYAADEIARIRARAQDPAYAKDVDATLRAAETLMQFSDEELWDMVPPADLTRALTVRYEFDCPVHGKEIYKVGGRFPWITDVSKPYKVECPVGHEVYPSNDFAAYLKGGRKEKLDVHEKYVDDGNGYVDEQGNRYFFAGYYNFWRLWRKTLIEGIASCGNAYLVTGDRKYAHKAAIALASISRVYPQMDYSKQAYHNGKWPAAINGRVLDYIWENQTVASFSAAYAQIRDSLADDEALAKFAKERGIANVKEAIEQNILQEMARDLLAKKIWGNKFELRSTAMLALILDNNDPAKGVTTPQMVDWLLKDGGDLEFTFYNGFDRDGWGGESSLGYSGIWNAMTIAAADDLARLGAPIVKDPKWLRLAKAGLEMRLLKNLMPRIGDVDGDIRGKERVLNDDLLAFGVTYFSDPDCAKALLKKGSYKPPLLSRSAIDEPMLKQLAAKATFPAPPYTRDLDGYGLAILELDNGAETQSATMYYGSPMASHGHNDRLTMSLHLGERDVLPDLGYPSQWGPQADWWVKNSPSHYTVLVDEQPQTARYAGHLTRFADLEGFKFAEAQAREVWDAPPPPAEVPLGSIGGEKHTTAPAREPAGPPVTDYRRMMALMDTGEKSTLLVEAFRVAGGRQHDYAFHGLPFGKFSLEGVKVVREQKSGTVAGEEVEFGADLGRRGRSGYQYLSSPTWYEPGDTPHARWLDDDGINQETWFPRLAFDQLVVADGIPPTAPGAPDKMPFILLRNRGEEGLQSLFISITEAGKKDAKVKRVASIQSDSPESGGAIIEMKSGAVWKVYVNSGQKSATFKDGTQSSLAFVAIRIVDGKPAIANLIGEGKIKTADGVEVSGEGNKPMTIQSVDYATRRVTVDGSLPSLEKNGTVLLASREGSPSAAYTARSAEGSTLAFGDIPLITGRFEAAWDPVAGKILSKERTGGVYNQFVARSFVGMNVVSEDFKTTAVITAHDLEKNTFTISADDEAAKKFADLDGDGRAYVYIADLAPGVKLAPTSARVVHLSGSSRK